MKLKTEAAKQLFKAVGLIDTPERWCKGAPQRGEARCVVEAISSVGAYVDSAARSVLWLALDAGPQNDGSWSPLAAVNDHPDTTHDDIMMAFAMAITLAEEAGT